MYDEEEIKLLRKRVFTLEKQIKITWLFGLLLIAVILLLVQPQGRVDHKTLYAEQIVVQDEQGRPRIVLGAPVTAVEGRVRSDTAYGIVLINKWGVDRISIGAPVGNPISGRDITERVSPLIGVAVNDVTGEETGSFGVMEDDRSLLVLGRKNAREVILMTSDEVAAMWINYLENKPAAYLGFNGFLDETKFRLNAVDADGKIELSFDSTGISHINFSQF